MNCCTNNNKESVSKGPNTTRTSNDVHLTDDGSQYDKTTNKYWKLHNTI